MLFQFFEKKFYLSLSRSLRPGEFRFSRHLLNRATAAHASLIKSASSKMFRGRRTAEILENDEIRGYIEKYVHLHLDEFSDEIFYEKLAMRNENTKMFFSLVSHKFRVSHRNLVKAILYVMEEQRYFSFRESILLAQPKTYRQMIVQCARYLIIHKRNQLDAFEVKRMAYSIGLSVSIVPVRLLMWTVKDEELSVAMSDGVPADSAPIGLGVRDGNYEVQADDYKTDSQVDRFYSNHVKSALVQHFGNRCVCCEKQKSVNLVHFWRAKAQGGNFAMKIKHGSYVNNCLPMCTECQITMGETVPFEFLKRQRVEVLLERSWNFNSYLNTKLTQLDDNTFKPSLMKKAA